jgi:hypothetical protein
LPKVRKKKARKFAGKKGFADATEHHLLDIQGSSPRVSGCSQPSPDIRLNCIPIFEADVRK